MKVKNKILWITQTAIFLSILIAVQLTTRPFGTLVTGTLVNTILILATLLVGLSSGATIALISPFLATLFGIVYPLFEIIPLIALANLILVTIADFVQRRIASKARYYYILQLILTMLGGIIKASFLFVSIVVILIPILNLPALKASALSSAFSLPQYISAILGSMLAVSAYHIIKKRLH